MIQFLGFQIFDGPEGDMLADFSQAESVVISDGEHGFEALTAFVPMTEDEAFRWYTMSGVLWAVLSAGWGTAWEGRVEDVAIVDGGLKIGAFGAWRVMSDAPYTALWGKTSTADWQQVTADNLANHAPQMYTMDNNNRLFIGLLNNQTYTSGADIGALTYAAPHNGSRDIIAFMCRYEMLLPSNWLFRIQRSDDDFSSVNLVTGVTATGSLQTGVLLLTFTGSLRLMVRIFNNSGGVTTFAGDNGSNYVKLTSIRIATTTANVVNTTLGTGVPAGTWTVTPASMENIYVGQQLVVGGGAGNEIVTVTAVTATTFTATFTLLHTGADPVLALVAYGDEVASDLVDLIHGLNPDQLRDNKDIIQSTLVDLTDEIYEDAWPADILTNLAARGDSEGNQYEVGVWENRTLHFRPRNSAARTWVVDARDLTVSRSLEGFRNQMYAVYQDRNGRFLRTAVQTDGSPLSGGIDLTSQPVPPFSRRGYIDTNTTSQVQAEKERDIAITDLSVIVPRAGFIVDALYDEAGGGPYPKWMARSGDLVIVQNLSPGLGTAVDRIRQFRIKGKQYNVIDDTLDLTPESELPELAVMVANSFSRESIVGSGARFSRRGG